MEEAVTTGACEDAEGFPFIIHPAKALTLEAPGAGVNGCTKLRNKRK